MSSGIDALQWAVLETPHSTKNWIALIQATAQHAHANDVERANAINIVYERAVRALPASYKLWSRYLRFRHEETKTLCSPQELFQSIRALYERAVEKLPTMPMLWVRYVEFLMASPVLRITMTRQTIGRGLHALPSSQHDVLWSLVRRWTRSTQVPLPTVELLWSAYCRFHPSALSTQQYLDLLQLRGDTNTYLRVCSEVACGGPRAPHDAQRLLGNALWWEAVEIALRTATPGWSRGVEEVAKLVEVGHSRCLSPVRLLLAHIIFLYGQGMIAAARTALRRALEEAADPLAFAALYEAAVEVEDQVLDAFATDERLRTITDENIYAQVVRRVFGGEEPMRFLQELVESYPLWLNQSQLRGAPRSAPLWLKRAEMVEEEVGMGKRSPQDLVELLRQAIARCSAGMSHSHPAVGQLVERLAHALVEADKPAEAVEVLCSAAWSTHFSSVAVNAYLLGLSVELRLSHALATPQEVLLDMLHHVEMKKDGLNKSGTLTGGRPRRMGLLTSSTSSAGGAAASTLAEVRDDARVWLLCFDLALRSCTMTEVQHVLGSLASSVAYTPEAACYVARRLHQRGEVDSSLRVLEEAANLFRDRPAAMVVLLSQHFSALCSSVGQPGADTCPLEAMRELYQVLLDITPAALARTAVAVVELHVACALVEKSFGLFGAAVRIMRTITIMAISTLSAEDHLAVLCGLIEKSIAITIEVAGVAGLRPFGAELIRRVEHPLLLQRIALQWAAAEKRGNQVAAAHTILSACSKSQDPRTAHGAVFWSLWESACVDVQQFEEVGRCRQQAATYHEARTPAAGEVEGDEEAEEA